MTLKQERLCALSFLMVIPFFTYRQIERNAWMNEIRYSQGIDDANVTEIYRVMNKPFPSMAHHRRHR